MWLGLQSEQTQSVTQNSVKRHCCLFHPEIFYDVIKRRLSFMPTTTSSDDHDSSPGLPWTAAQLLHHPESLGGELMGGDTQPGSHLSGCAF